MANKQLSYVWGFKFIIKNCSHYRTSGKLKVMGTARSCIFNVKSLSHEIPLKLWVFVLFIIFFYLVSFRFARKNVPLKSFKNNNNDNQKSVCLILLFTIYIALSERLSGDWTISKPKAINIIKKTH